jgi:hypothetical protein
MPQPVGFTIPLSLARRHRCDLIHLARQTPTQVMQRNMNLGITLATRSLASPRPSWHAIFTKAYALVAQLWPQLRRAYLSFPLPHVYEHPACVASVALERRFLDEDALFYVPICQPDLLALNDLDLHLRRCKDQPVEQIGAFRRSLLFTRLPGPIRRWLWWLTLNALGRKRAASLGTYAVSACPALGAELLQPLAFVTSTLTFGVIHPNGSVDVRISSDPRVLDAPLVARVLVDLERVLTHEIVAELRYLEAVAEAA